MRGLRRTNEDSLPLLQDVKIMTAASREKTTPSGTYNAPHQGSSDTDSENIHGRFCLIRLVLIYDLILFLIPRPLLKDSDAMTFRWQWGVIKYKPIWIRSIDLVCCLLSIGALTVSVIASLGEGEFCREEGCSKSPFDYFVTLHDDNTIFAARASNSTPNTASTSTRRLLSYSNSSNATNDTVSTGDATDGSQHYFNELINQNLSNAIALFQESVNGFCNQSESIKVATISREWNNITYDGIHFQQEAPTYFSDFTVSHWMPSGYYPWLVLWYIFAVSILFQFYRYSLNNYDGDKTIKDIDVARLFKTMFFQSAHLQGKIPYDQKKPDFWRWVEYAATSPFQILLIANSVLITDRGKLLALMSAQAALVMLGCINEHFIDKCFKKMVKAWQQKKQDKEHLKWPQMAGNNFLKIRILLFISWLVFVSIWWSILSAFERQERNTYTCNYKERMPAAIWFIIGTQFGFFALFGCVQTVQYFQLLCLELDMKMYEKNEDLYYDKTMDKLLTEEQSNEISNKQLREGVPKGSRDSITEISDRDNGVLSFLKKRRQQSWQNTALAYSMLSVLAKTTLEFGFIWFVLFSSNSQVTTG